MPETKPSAASTAGDATEPPAETPWDKLYGERYYRTYDTVPYGRNEQWMTLFGSIAEHIVHDLAPESVLDAGCAMGILVEQLAMRGVDAWGVDISEFAISNAPDLVRDKVWVGSLTDKLPRRYDLITCIEVLEHLPTADSRAALANLCGATDRILFSSVPGGYEEPTHVNVQPPEDWSAWFAEEGFVRDLDHDASYLSPWAVLYERRRPHLPAVVRDYDRAVARLKDEVQQLRSSVLALHAELEAINEAADTAAGPEQDARSEDLREQLLALRDIVVGLEVELGEAMGQSAYYLALLAGKDAAAREYERVISSKAYRATVKALSPYRRVRGFIGR